ncbi:hypothetical protein [Bartonella rattimassiliensis]|uniref:hypothetical protein n=1 Tax=Bartonella rattimassiliensis TaxID=270250 RepID=UPI0002F1D5B4|nr:hypothetical protein [Bartonella rattimassiliensis]
MAFFATGQRFPCMADIGMAVLETFIKGQEHSKEISRSQGIFHKIERREPRKQYPHFSHLKKQ